MWPASSRLLAALTTSHAVVTKVQAWRNGVLLGDIDVAGGQVSITARSRVRRTFEFTAAEALYPTEPDDMLSPYGTEIWAWRGVEFGDLQDLVPVFRGRVEHVDDRSQFDGEISVRCLDLFATVNDARFENPRAAPTGQGVAATIQQLIVEAIPDASFVVAAGVDTSSAVPAGLMWDRDRGQAIDDLAKAIGAEVYADPTGTFRIRPVPTINDPAVWTVAEGANGTLVTTGRTVSREGVYNVVVVTGERATNTLPILATVADTDPMSPTYVGGPFGRTPRFYSSPLVTTSDQATTAGQALLARSIGATRTRNITAVPNPAQEAGDVITVTVAAGTETHIADTITLPLHAVSGSMSIGTRSTKADPGDS